MLAAATKRRALKAEEWFALCPSRLFLTAGAWKLLPTWSSLRLHLTGAVSGLAARMLQEAEERARFWGTASSCLACSARRLAAAPASSRRLALRSLRIGWAVGLNSFYLSSSSRRHRRPELWSCIRDLGCWRMSMSLKAYGHCSD